MKSFIASKIFNLLGFIFICLILAVTLYLEVSLSQKPCPLCLLKRLGMAALDW
jgi:disulfide bond formation protein DsbB